MPACSSGSETLAPTKHADRLDFCDNHRDRDPLRLHSRRGGRRRHNVTRGEHADPHLTPAGHRQGSVDNLQPIGTAELPDLNNPVARLFHGRSPCSSAQGQEKDHNSCATPVNSPHERGPLCGMRASGWSGRYIIMPMGLSMMSSAVFFWSVSSAV